MVQSSWWRAAAQYLVAWIAQVADAGRADPRISNARLGLLDIAHGTGLVNLHGHSPPEKIQSSPPPFASRMALVGKLWMRPAGWGASV
jgi:hypothetical protein